MLLLWSDEEEYVLRAALGGTASHWLVHLWRTILSSKFRYSIEIK